MSEFGVMCWEWIGSEEGDSLTLKHVLTLTIADATLARGLPKILLARYYVSAVCKSPRDPQNVPALETNEFPTSHLKIKTTEQNQWFPALTFLNPYMEAQHVQQTECGASLTEACVSVGVDRKSRGADRGPAHTWLPLGFLVAPETSL